MRHIKVRFEQTTHTQDIEVVIRAPRQDAEVDALMKRLRDPAEDMLSVEDTEGLSVLLEKDHILSVSSNGKKLKVIATDGAYECKMTLQDMEQALQSRWFLRISRYEIIHLKRVEKFDFSVSGSLHIFMEQGFETWASRRYIPVIKKRLKGEMH